MTIFFELSQEQKQQAVAQKPQFLGKSCMPTILKHKPFSLLRKGLFVAVMCIAATAKGQSWSDERVQESLLASTWTGEILGIPFIGYLLDESLLIALAGDQKARFERWNIRDGKLSASVTLSNRAVVGFDRRTRRVLARHEFAASAIHSRFSSWRPLFIAHHLPKGLAVDEVFTLNTEKATQMRVVDEGQP